MTTFYKATHPTTRNTVLRKSERPGYTFAAIGPKGMKNANFSATMAGAQKLLPKFNAAGWTVVPAVEITREEFAAADKANKQFFKVAFMGKTYSSSLPATQDAYVCAVGYDRPAITDFIKCQPQDAERLEWLQKHSTPEQYERALLINARGGYDMDYRAERGVFWFSDREHAREYMDKRAASDYATEKATTYTLLDLAA